MTLIEAAQKAMEALNAARRGHCDHAMADEAIAALRAAIERAEKQEPVGEVVEAKQSHFDDDGCVIGSYNKKFVTSGVYKLPHGTKLYTTPPAAPVQEPPCQTCEALARTVMMDQTGRDA
jgi:hypothetical protein